MTASTADAGSRAAGGAGAAGGREMAAVTVCATLSATPVFLLGAVAVLVRDELEFDEVRLGAAVSLFWAASALTAVPAGRVMELFGARRAILTGSALSAGASVGVGLFARSWLTLVLLLVAGGVAHGMLGPAGGLAIARWVPTTRQGLAFGLKQCAPPLAALLGGLALPAVALTVGWRWAFALAAVLAVVLVVLLPAPAPAVARPRRLRNIRDGDVSVAALVMLSVAVAFGAMSAGATGAFFVESAVAFGFTQRSAGVLLACGSLLSVVVRVAAGRLADGTKARLLPAVVTMLLLGACGLAVLSLGRHHGLAVLGTFLALGPGWGWNGLLQLAVIRVNPNAPGAATGMIQAGGATGAVVGPLVVGGFLRSGSVTSGWLVMAAAAFLAALLVLAARRLMRRDIASRAVPASAA